MSYRPPLRSAVCAALALTAAACADSPSAGVPAPAGPGTPAQLRLTCSADVRKGTVRCVEPGGVTGVRADRIMGQGSGMSVVSGNIAVVADTFAFDLAAANGLSYPVGTSDGVSADPNGIRVFVVDGIHTTQGTGAVAVANADGVGAFTASNQPYFAYPGILLPDSATAAHRWKFRFDPGVQQFTFGLYLSVPVPPGGGGVWMKVLKPVQSTVVGDSVVVLVRIDSASASIASIHASAAGRRVRLVRIQGVNDFNQVQGTLSLAGLPKQALQIVVDAGTIRGDTASVTVGVTKDAPPRVTVTAPVVDWVASPYLRIDAECVDDDPAGCIQIKATARAGLGDSNPTRTLATGTTSLHLLVDLSTSHEEKYPRIDIFGTDSRGATHTGFSSEVNVESEPSIARIDSAGSLAMDLDSTRLLFADIKNRVWLRNRLTGARTLLSADSAFYRTARGWLYPGGQLFEQQDEGRDVAGSWAIRGFEVVRRTDLTTGTDVLVTSTAYGMRDVADNGDVVFARTDREVYRYRGGVTTPLTADLDSAHWNLNPVTDGDLVVYFKSNQAGNTATMQSGRVTLWKAGVETPLSPSPIPYTVRAEPDYAVTGGWVAYPVLDGIGFAQVRTRAPDGTDRLATFAASSSVARALSADGTLVYSNGAGLYAIRAPYTGTPTRLGANWLRPVFRGSRLLLFLSNSVFEATY